MLAIKTALLTCVALLCGCSGLNVAWVFQASYNTPATTSATIQTAPEKK